jgi:hypothetical protein
MQSSLRKWVGLVAVLLVPDGGWTQSAWRKIVDAHGHVTYTNVGLPSARPTGRYSLNPAKYQAFEAYIDTLAREHGLSKKLILAVIAIESDFQSRALSPKGAIGLMQLLPETARLYGVRNPWDPYENRYGGVPPFAETQAYVRKVLGIYGQAYTHVYRFEDANGVVHYSFEAPDPRLYRNVRRIPLTVQAYQPAGPPAVGSRPMEEGASPSGEPES